MGNNQIKKLREILEYSNADISIDNYDFNQPDDADETDSGGIWDFCSNLIEFSDFSTVQTFMYQLIKNL